jgi:hypothetical protein
MNSHVLIKIAKYRKLHINTKQKMNKLATFIKLLFVAFETVPDDFIVVLLYYCKK